MGTVGVHPRRSAARRGRCLGWRPPPHRDGRRERDRKVREARGRRGREGGRTRRRRRSRRQRRRRAAGVVVPRSRPFPHRKEEADRESEETERTGEKKNREGEAEAIVYI